MKDLLNELHSLENRKFIQGSEITTLLEKYRGTDKQEEMDEAHTLEIFLADLGVTKRVLYDLLSRISTATKKRGICEEDLADIGFLCREGENLCDDWRKEFKRVKELIGMMIALIVVQSEEPKDIVRGRLASATPDIKMVAERPQRGTDNYLKFCDFLNVPREISERGILKVDWNLMEKLLTEGAQAGENPPPGIQNQRPKYVATFRRRKN